MTDNHEALTPRQHAALRFILATYITDLYDDPTDLADRDLEDVEGCATFLGFDMWDVACIRDITGYIVSASEVERLRRFR